MSNAIRVMRLDLIMSKQYAKTFLICVAFSIVYAVLLRVFLGGVLFSAFLAATASCYPFATEETCGAGRMYGMLPIRRRQAVAGRYLYTVAVGIATILVCVGISAVAYLVAGMDVDIGDMAAGLVAGFVMFIVSVAFQIPGYYKLGATKGRVITFIPMALYFGSYALIGKVGVPRILSVLGPFADPKFMALGIVALMVIMLLISFEVSVKIYREKGM